MISIFTDIYKKFNLNVLKETDSKNFPDTLRFQITLTIASLTSNVKDPTKTIKMLENLKRNNYLFRNNFFYSFQLEKEMFGFFSMLGDFSQCLQKAKELKEIIKGNKNRFLQTDTANKLGYSYLYTGNIDLAEKFYKEALDILGKEIINSMGYNSRISLAYIQALKGNKLESIKQYEKIEKDYKGKIILKNLIYLYENIGSIYREIGEFNPALSYLKKALKISRKLKEHFLLIYIYYNLASIYLERENHKKALEIYNKGLETAKKVKDRRGLTMGYVSLAITKEKQQHFRQATKYYKIALEQAKTLNSPQLFLMCKIRLAKNYFHCKKFSKTKKECLEAEKFLQKIPSFIREKMEIYFLKGEILFQENKTEECLLYIKQAQKMAEKIHDKFYQKNIRGFLRKHNLS